MHFWSLAVEEQFYLAWPFIVLACDLRTLARLCCGMFVIALALRVLCGALGMADAAYALTPCRMDSLAAGALVAVLQREGVSRETMLRWATRLGVLACVGIAAIWAVRGVFKQGERLAYTLGITFVAAGSAALVIAACFAGEGTRIHRALSSAWLRALGRVSYGMYIVHLPILCVMVVAGLDLRHAKPVLGGNLAPWLALETLLGGGFIYLVSLASWHAYEKRVLGLKRYFE